MILALLLACAPPPAEPGLLVVVIDSLRADSSAVDLLPDGGRRYVNAYSAAPWTSSSTWTLTTGRLPDHDWAKLAPWRMLAQTPTGWLAEVGITWPDHVVTDHPVVGALFGVPLEPYRQAEAAVDLDHGGAWYLHVEGAHTPYDGHIGPHYSSASRRYHAVIDAPESAEPMDMPADLAAWAPLAYDPAATHAVLRARPLVARAIAAGWTVALTADHGEALGEDGLWGHATSLHDAQVRVPLYVWGPGVEPGTDPTPVPATCVGQTARLVLGEPLTDACDLRDGTIRGDVVSGMLLADGTWDERIVPAEVAP